MAMSREEKNARARARYAARKAGGTLAPRKRRSGGTRAKTERGFARAARRRYSGAAFSLDLGRARKIASRAKTKTQARAMAGKLARLERAAKKIATTAKKAKKTARTAAKGAPRKRATRGGRRRGAA